MFNDIITAKEKGLCVTEKKTIQTFDRKHLFSIYFHSMCHNHKNLQKEKSHKKKKHTHIKQHKIPAEISYIIFQQQH